VSAGWILCNTRCGEGAEDENVKSKACDRSTKKAADVEEKRESVLKFCLPLPHFKNRKAREPTLQTHFQINLVTPVASAAIGRCFRRVQTASMAEALIEAADLLRRRPDFFTIRNITLVERPRYMGAYFELTFGIASSLQCHITIGHWDRDAPALSPQQLPRLMTRIKEALELGFQFSDSPVQQMDEGRVIVTVHVQSALSRRWWAVQQSACSVLNVKERPVFHVGIRGRDNFHVSVDARRP
jgi:hypothetical protein